jgi:hypothetical protein
MKEIKKMIDTSKLVPAPLDNKNVMLDWLEENMFDDESYAFSGNTYLGFIAGVPVMATIKDNFVELKCIPQPFRSMDKLDDFGNAVIRNITGDDCHLLTAVISEHKQYIDDEREEDMKLLVTFSIYNGEAIISFHWNVPKD